MLNYVNRVIVGTSDGSGDGTSALSALTRGDISIFDANLSAVPLANGAAKQPFYIAVGTGDPDSPFILSSKIDPNNAFFAIKDARVAADQVSKVALPVTTAVGDSVTAIIAFKDRLRLLANKQTRIVMAGEAESTDGYDLASKLAKQAVLSSPYKDPYGVRVDVIATGTPTYLTLTEDVTVTKGSTAISYAADPSFSAGDIISIRGVAYKLVSSDATDGVLDRAYAGASETIDVSAETTAVGSLASITAIELQATGLASPYNNPEIDLYEKPTFEFGGSSVVAATGVETALVETAVTAMDLGQGVYEQVKRMEFDAQGYLGNTNLRQWPIPVFDYHATSGVAYDVVNIMAQDEHEGDLQNQMKSPIGVTLAFNAGTTTQRDAIFAILEDVMGRAGELSFA